ncbi:enoyl-CoA hydratase/isomerase family protein [Haloferax sp. ATB1]|uniref:enoyl-CoA hydratase/isomerase family protein n=1 Tax=Haloferax sp. ATB1 TaxID=1508454 RepID=UPI0005B1F5BE|nr:enoyl-CoA hydratase/isomerase family protein [Haloferax sp. ATB1]
MEAEFETITLKYDEETGIGHLTLDRPEALNTLNPQLKREIVAGLEELEAKNDETDGVALRAVVIEGAGDRAFCAGVDVGGFEDKSKGARSERSPYELIKEFPAPVIAKIQGYCLGGGLEMAFACDFRFASADSTFGLPEVGLGIIPGAGGIQYVARLASPAVAKELVMTAKHFSAERAAEEGLVHDIYEVDALDDEVQTFTESIASQAPLAVQATKKSVAIAMENGLDSGLVYDRSISESLVETQDAKEGMKAFAEDREPDFMGK